jgi:hypothetical protein
VEARPDYSPSPDIFPAIATLALRARCNGWENIRIVKNWIGLL